MKVITSAYLKALALCGKYITGLGRVTIYNRWIRNPFFDLLSVYNGRNYDTGKDDYAYIHPAIDFDP